MHSKTNTPSGLPSPTFLHVTQSWQDTRAHIRQLVRRAQWLLVQILHHIWSTAICSIQLRAFAQLFVSADVPPSSLFALLMADEEEGISQRGASLPPFEDAPVGGHFRVDGELASFFTAKDEGFMLRRALSRLAEMCPLQACP